MSKKLLSEAQVRKFMGLANVDANVSSAFLNEMYKEEVNEEYGGKKGDESKSHRDYMKEEEVNEEYGGKKGDESKSHRDYMNEEEMEMDAEIEADPEGGDLGEPDEEGPVDVELNRDDVEDAMAKLDDAHEKLSDLLNKLMGGAAEEPEMEIGAEEEIELDEEYGGKKGDESKSHRDYVKEEYGGKKGDESKSRRDYMKEEEELDEEYGGKKGDESKSRRDYMNEEEMVQEVAKRVAARINEAARAQKKSNK